MKSDGKKEKEMNLEKEFARAEQLFDSNPNTYNANALNLAKEKLGGVTCLLR